jgi:twitching motility protein PilT
MVLDDILNIAVEKRASDVHLAVGASPLIRMNGDLISLGEERLSAEELNVMCSGILDEKQLTILAEEGQVDFAYRNDSARFRVNVFKDRKGLAVACRVIGSKIPSFQELGLPSVMESFSKLRKGLVLVTGPTGSGKSTTLASLVDEINGRAKGHIITLEDPIEYLHEHKMSLVNQREIHEDARGFGSALRAALRQDPDVILVGEMRDLDTISTAITAAETGHLVLSTLHTSGAAQTVDRIIDVFPPHQQAQIRLQLSMVLEGIVSQKLLPGEDGKSRVAAFEVMTGTNAVRSLIREGKAHQLQMQIQTGSVHGMISMDNSIHKLYRDKLIKRETALSFAEDPEGMKKLIAGNTRS